MQKWDKEARRACRLAYQRAMLARGAGSREVPRTDALLDVLEEVKVRLAQHVEDIIANGVVVLSAGEVATSVREFPLEQLLREGEAWRRA